jgi:hypothetical protein
MERLTGFALRNTVEDMRARGIEKSEILVACGYGRKNKGPNYTEFYQELIKVNGYWEAMQVREAERNNYSNMRQKEVCDSVFYGHEYKRNNDEVRYTIHNNQFSNAKITSFHFFGELLVEIIRGDGPVYLILHIPSKKSKTVKARINAILRRTLGYSLYQKKGEWFIARPLKADVPYTEGVRLDHPEM